MIESGTDGDSRSRSRVRNAATAELTAELAVRDAILGRVDQIRTRLEEVDPGVRRGIPRRRHDALAFEPRCGHGGARIATDVRPVA